MKTDCSHYNVVPKISNLMMAKHPSKFFIRYFAESSQIHEHFLDAAKTQKLVLVAKNIIIVYFLKKTM